MFTCTYCATLTRCELGLPLLVAGGIGDDVYSVGFDGARYWVGGRAIDTSLTFAPTRKSLPRQEEHVLFSPSHSPSPSPTPPDEGTEQLPISVGDVIGCCLDLERGVASFLKNGVPIEGCVEFHHCCKNITPALSFSAGVRYIRDDLSMHVITCISVKIGLLYFSQEFDFSNYSINIPTELWK